MRSRFTLLAVFLVAILARSALAQTEDAKPVADVDLGLSKGSVFDVAVPPVPQVNVVDPGDQPPVERAFASAPPRVPHAVADFMPITRDENWCVDCHDLDWMDPEEDEPTPVPFSHYMDLRGDSDDIGEEIVGARWVCVSCHVPVTDAPALVESTFGE